MSGPGTELKKLLSNLGINPCGKCNLRADQMDSYGINWCERNTATIKGWMREESFKRSLPFFERAANALILIAIHRAKKKHE